MAYLAVDADGAEYIYKTKPYRHRLPIWKCDYKGDEYGTELPHGSIAKLIGRELTWEDEPVIIE